MILVSIANLGLTTAAQVTWIAKKRILQQVVEEVSVFTH